MYNISSEDYTFCEALSEDHYAVRIKTGKFENVIFTFGKIQVVEKEDKAFVNFTYKIESNEHEHLNKDSEFGDYIGEILHHILEDSLNDAIAKHSNDNTKESTDERGVHS
jgi:hypothetical protein